MFTRRAFAAALIPGLAMPAVLRAQTGTASDVLAAARALDPLHAILVQRGDALLVSDALRGPGLARLANIKSCSKSILGLLLGSAIERNDLPGIGARLADVAPALIPADATAGVEEVTLADLVTLRLGLQGTSGPNYGAWVASRNWIAYALRQPRLSPDGTAMVYSTGTTHVLGAALATVTGKSLLELARERLGGPLGFEVPPWTRDPQGYYFGGNEMALTPEAMLRLAVMMRDGGRYGGTQIIAAEWIAASQRAVTVSPWSGLGYGYGWFRSSSGWTIARGYGGQIIASHSEKALAVAITSDPTLPARSEGHFGDLTALLDGPIMALA